MKKSAFVPPSYGEIWPGQGGVVVDFVPSMGGKPGWYLIAPTGDVAEKADVAWGPRDTEVAGANSDWDGLANTKAMQATGKHAIADWAAKLSIDGHSDFYLPSKREMRLLWARVPELFQPRWYWSSTQFSRDVAWLQDFYDGHQGSNVKSYEARVRAVRRLTIS